MTLHHRVKLEENAWNLLCLTLGTGDTYTFRWVGVVTQGAKPLGGMPVSYVGNLAEKPSLLLMMAQVLGCLPATVKPTLNPAA